MNKHCSCPNHMKGRKQTVGNLLRFDVSLEENVKLDGGFIMGFVGYIGELLVEGRVKRSAVQASSNDHFMPCDCLRS